MLRPAQTPPRFLTLVLMSAVAVASLNMMLASLLGIADSFAAPYGLVNLSVAGYAAVTAVLQIVVGPLSDRFGRRPVILTGIAVYIAASIGCLLAPDVWVFVACRMLQAAVVAGYTVSLAVVRDMVGAREAAGRLGYLAMSWSMAPLLAPIVGGLLDTAFGWRATFAFMTLLGAGIFALAWADLGETNVRRSASLLQQARGYPALLRSRLFWAYTLCLAFSNGAFYIFLAGAPIVAIVVFGMPVAWLGVVLGTITGGFVLGTFLSGRFAARFGPVALILTGRVAALVGTGCGLAVVLSGVVELVLVFGACMFVGFGNGLTLPSVSAGVMSVRPDLAGSAAGLLGACAIGTGALLSAVSGLLIRPEAAAQTMLSLLFVSALVALLAGLMIRVFAQRAESDSGN